jgi:hypothetical protein
MIRKNLINCKLFDEKRSGKAILNDCMDHLDLQEEECPCCGNKGCLHVHAYYERTLIDFVDDFHVFFILNESGKTRLWLLRPARPGEEGKGPLDVDPYLLPL